MSYDHASIEPKWQGFWETNQVFRTEHASPKPKYYILDMFPYPSSSGLHVGHPEGYTATDILARYKRAKGFNVLHPMGWDAFGLPAEQYALKTGVHPAKTTYESIDNFRRQLRMLGFSYDWTREIATCDPGYYKWTQFIFLKLHERGLAYKRPMLVNYCPALKTVLANEEVVDGKSERGGHPVHRIAMQQWVLKITDYAERLLKDLDQLDWPESTKELQRNWIGRSEGLQMRFPLADAAAAQGEIEIFTTRPDTIFGATYMVLAPEHPLVGKITAAAQKSAVEAYRQQAALKSEMARQDATKEKTGAFTGASAINPFNGEKIPVWIADYVMMGYGTGAIMAVPAHDERDLEFAKAFGLPIREVISAEGIAIDSGFITGKPTAEATETVIRKAEKDGLGRRAVQYRLRDWLFSRQRYWGEPFPIVYTNGAPEAVPADALPVRLPDVESYQPMGDDSGPKSPLAGAPESWRLTRSLQGEAAERETDTMPGSAGSSWYFLRYIDPKNDKEPWSREAEKHWMPVDLYLGGPEHAVGHLLYARFWTKVLFDAGLVTHDEPFKKLVHQGMILGEDGEKMSKSRGNVINPDDVVARYGADTLRCYEMFMGPLERDKPWSTTAIEGSYRFLSRAWRIFVDEGGKLLVTSSEATAEDLKILHKTVKKVSEDVEGLRFNTAISQMMIFVNHFTKESRYPPACLRPFIQLLQPFAPHLAEELWERLGEKSALSYEPWPGFDPTLAKDDLVTMAIQVMGKTRGTVEVEPGADQATVEREARKIPQVLTQLEGKQVRKVIFVPNKILNFVT